jgi:hypothetical protein
MDGSRARGPSGAAPAEEQAAGRTASGACKPLSNNQLEQAAMLAAD